MRRPWSDHSSGAACATPLWQSTQVAAFASHHLSVQKTSVGSRTQTTVVELTKKDRKDEIARMLGGPVLTKKSLENAAELLETAQR